MLYLIDGHNLIAQMPELSLADPNDEAQLVWRLRQFAARKRCRITVVFDHGVPGGWSRELSTGAVQVVFAGSHTNADRVILERIRETKTPGNLRVVSSDSEVRRAAEARRAGVIPAQEFARILSAPPCRKAHHERDHISLSQDEVKEWMRLFEESR